MHKVGHATHSMFINTRFRVGIQYYNSDHNRTHKLVLILFKRIIKREDILNKKGLGQGPAHLAPKKGDRPPQRGS